MVSAPTFTATFHEDALEIGLAAPRRLPPVLFTGFWASGWLLIVVGLALEILRHPDIDLERNALWLAVWLAAGPTVGFVLLWLAAGQREVVRIDGSRLSISRLAGPFSRTRQIDTLAIRSIGSRAAQRRARYDVAPVARFWRGGIGRVIIETGRGLYAVGEALTDEQADEIVTLIQGRLAHVHLATADRPQPPPSQTRRHVAGCTMALLVAILLWPAATVPVRLAIVDRAICFPDDPTPPEEPVRVHGARADKRLVLVALDGIDRRQLESVVENVRTRYRIPAYITEFRSIEAYDPGRRQLDAARVIAALQRSHPNGRTVVIAVTDRDMFIPGFPWRYAFSYRSRERLAVVSTARMDRGCLGVFAAGEARQHARLRKMIGKNVGVLYYGLPLSSDPRSLLYANIGGPQELDVMSEQF